MFHCFHPLVSPCGSRCVRRLRHTFPRWFVRQQWVKICTGVIKEKAASTVSISPAIGVRGQYNVLLNKEATASRTPNLLLLKHHQQPAPKDSTLWYSTREVLALGNLVCVPKKYPHFRQEVFNSIEVFVSIGYALVYLADKNINSKHRYCERKGRKS